VFLTTPVNGIRDANITFVAQPRFKLPYLYNTELLSRYHPFYAERTSVSFGSKVDLQATDAITPKLIGLVIYADYFGVTKLPNRNKVWFSVEYSL
jgi:hypothetical protein